MRAAFLTYHLLGHFIQRCAPEDSLHGDTCVVCPAVGLQCYNYQVLLALTFSPLVYAKIVLIMLD